MTSFHGTISLNTTILNKTILNIYLTTIRRTDLKFDCYDGIFIYTNSTSITDNMPSWHHPFNFSDFASLKDNRKDKLKKLYESR